MLEAVNSVEIFDFYNEKLAEGNIFDYSNDTISVKIIKANVQLIIDKRILVKITTPFTKVSEKYEAVIKDVKKGILVLHRLKPLDPRNLRKYLQIKTDMKTKILHFMDTKNNLLYPNGIEINIKDLSAGGIYFTSSEEFIGGVMLVFPLILESIPLVVTAKIIRVEKKEKGFGYGCCFISLNEEEKKIISRYTYKRQAAIEQSKTK